MAKKTTFSFLTWERNGRTIKTGSYYELSLNLTIRSPAWSHGGKYTCKANFMDVTEATRTADAGFLNMHRKIIIKYYDIVVINFGERSAAVQRFLA